MATPDPYAEFADEVDGDPYAEFADEVAPVTAKRVQRKPADIDPRTGKTRAQLEAELAQAEAAPTPSAFGIPAGPALETARDWIGGALEPLAALTTSSIAGPVAGIAGLGAAEVVKLGNLFGLTDASASDAGANVVRSLSDALTYAPRTQAGTTATNVVTYPFQKIAEGGDVAGGFAADVTGSPAVGAGVNTAIQSLPALLLRGRGGGKVAPTTDAAALTRAQDYVTRTAGVDFNALPREIQATLTSVAKDAGALDALPPEAVARQLQLQSLDVPVPATAGQLTRDPVQLRREANVSATDAGAPIREVHLEQNQALLDNIDILRGRVAGRGTTGSTAQTPEQVGTSVQDQALRPKLEKQEAKVKGLYDKADAAGETAARVSPRPLLDRIKRSPDKTHFAWVEQWLKDMDIVTDTPAGRVTTKPTIRELEDLRQAARTKTKNGGADAHYAGEIINAIDQATAGAGGDLYKAARKARTEQGIEFEDQKSVARLVDDTSRTDRATALEDTWRKTVLGGSIQDLRNVKRSLLTGGDAATRTAGRVAWRDMRAQTMDFIKREATRGVATNERGVANVTPASMKRAVDSIGADKLNEIFGPGTATKVNRILEAVRTVKTDPPARSAGSTTLQNVLSVFERNLNKIPVIGNVASGTVAAVAKARELGAGGRAVREAQRSPIDQAAARAAEYARRASDRRNVLESLPAATATQGERRLGDQLIEP